MKLVGKVPVEPLDDERLTNIERNLVVHVSEMSQRPARAPRRILAFAGVALAVVVAGFVGWKLRGDGTPVVGPSEPERMAMKAGALHIEGAEIVGKDFDVTRRPGRVDIVMQPGKLDLHVEHQPGRLLVVHAGDVEIEDIGTRFSVDWDGKNNVDVRVSEGEVKVKRGGKAFPITAGNAWAIDIGPVTITALDAKRAAAAAAVAAVDDSQTKPEIVAVAPTEGKTPDASSTSGGGSNGGSAQGSGAKPKTGTANAKKALEKAEYDAPDDVGTSDPNAAIAKYLEQIKNMPEGEDKARKLYSIAVMQHRAKNDSAAKHTISGVLKRQGGPAYYKAALWLNVRIDCLKAFDDKCRIAAEKYLAKFDSGQQAGVAQEILKEISRGQ